MYDGRGHGGEFLLRGGLKFPGGGGGALGAAFLFDVLGAIGNFVVEALDFQSETKILGMLCIFFEERIPLGFQIVAFFLPDTGFGEHAKTPRWSVRLFLAGA